MTSDFRSLDDVLNNSPELIHIKNLVEEHNLEIDFYIIFPELKKLVKSVKFSKNTLKLGVENPTLRTELKFRELEILNKMNSFYKNDRFKRIQFSNK
jgi:hypothetical protein